MKNNEIPLWTLTGVLIGMFSSYLVTPEYTILGATLGGAISFMLANIVKIAHRGREDINVEVVLLSLLYFLIIFSLYYAALNFREYYWIYTSAVGALVIIFYSVYLVLSHRLTKADEIAVEPKQ
jgi:uncharacterized membrane protein